MEMRDYLKKANSYLEDVQFHIYDSEKSCKDLAKCLKALKWKWARSNFETPSAEEIKDLLYSLFERGERDVCNHTRDYLLKCDGCYNIGTGGFTIYFYFNVETMELYKLNVIFDIWQYKMERNKK